MFEEKVKVLSNREILQDTYLLKLEAPKGAKSATPGQFAMLNTVSSDGYMLRRPLSIHMAEGDCLYFLYSVIGKGTGFLARLRGGQTIKILAPLGCGYRLPENSTDILLIAGGRGIAPISFLAERALQMGIKTNLLLGARSSPYLYPAAYLPKGVDVIIFTDDGSSGSRGKVTDDFIFQIQGKNTVYACGPAGMYITMSEMLSKSKKNFGSIYPKIQVSLEARMACGVGACYGCVIETLEGSKKVCSDGPVFDLDKLLLSKVVI